ncbi:hypothetical protein N9H45_01050 [Opitutales bacterium]|nr:hypothetical protein [Opitutales bacterium]
MKKSWKKMAWVVPVVVGIYLVYFFTSTDQVTTITDEESKFIQETKDLIAELSKDQEVTTKLGLQSAEYNQTEPTLVITEVEKLSYQESEEDISQSLESSAQPDLPTEPAWKPELDVFLKGKTSPQKFLNSLTASNWKEARDALALAYEQRLLPKNKNFQDRFWTRVGEVGGQAVAEELLRAGDPAFAKILKGWAKKTPQEMFDYYADLNLKSPEVQHYLQKTNSREIPLMDQFSSGMIDEVLRNSDGRIGNAQLDSANDLIDHFLEKDKKKAESLMREFTERVTKGRDKDTLKQWVAGYKEPELQAGTAQRVIESGVFDKNPLEAVEFANSLESTKAKRSALSSAYARLAGGVNGHDPNITATELNAMEDGWQRDFALNGFAHGLVRKDPEAAIQWANSISNEGFRKVVTKNVTKRINAEVLPRLNSQGASKN